MASTGVPQDEYVRSEDACLTRKSCGAAEDCISSRVYLACRPLSAVILLTSHLLRHYVDTTTSTAYLAREPCILPRDQKSACLTAAYETQS